MSQKKLIFEMLTADPLNVCEIMLNIHCKKIRSFGGRLEVAHRLRTFSHALTLRGRQYYCLQGLCSKYHYMNYCELNKHCYNMLIVKYNLLFILYVIQIVINKANTVIIYIQHYTLKLVTMITDNQQWCN